MSKRNRNAHHPGPQRQAIRQALTDVPVDLLSGSVDERVAVAEPEPQPAVPAARDGKEEQQRRGWFGLARRQRAARGEEEPAAPVLHHHAFEIERRAQRLEEALAAARDDLGAAASELDEVHQRLAGVEDELAAEQRSRQHWERVASEQLSALDELGTQLNTVNAELHAEREAHEQTRLHTVSFQEQLSTLQAQWEQREAEVEALLSRERDEYHRTLEDERHTAERAHAEQAAQHREQVEQIQSEASAAIAALQQRIADGQAAMEAATAELGAARADIVRLTDDVEAVRGEALAATARAREADELRMRAEQRMEELGDELAYVRSEVMGSAGGRKKPKGIFGRGRPAPVKAAEKQTRAAVVPNDVAAPPVDPDVDDIIERRLFGSA
ncbi:MAG TPA: hypothetical protein VFC09_03530 [Candidatus Dormibacteraeota bacterium]|nr:hypothetical protein [Candidatus Dormibacteraeota bacterium]